MLSDVMDTTTWSTFEDESVDTDIMAMSILEYLVASDFLTDFNTHVFLESRAIVNQYRSGTESSFNKIYVSLRYWIGYLFVLLLGKSPQQKLARPENPQYRQYPYPDIMSTTSGLLQSWSSLAQSCAHRLAAGWRTFCKTPWTHSARSPVDF
jgi:hypothetical protein